VTESESQARIFNEFEFRHLLAREVQRSTRYQDFLTLCLVRASHSGVEADDFNTALSQRIADMLRSTDVVGLLGQDVAVLLVHTADIDAATIVERIRDRVKTFEPPGLSAPGPLVVRLGVASFPTDATADAVLVAHAAAQLEPAR
jgi:GGDEF domain-containing protein